MQDMEMAGNDSSVSMEIAESLLKSVIHHYQMLLDQTREIRKLTLSENASRITKISDDILSTYKSIKLLEDELVLYYQDDPTLYGSNLEQQRSALGEQSFRMTKTMIDKINDLVVINRMELKKISVGMDLLNKYHSGIIPGGKYINTHK